MSLANKLLLLSLACTTLIAGIHVKDSIQADLDELDYEQQQIRKGVLKRIVRVQLDKVLSKNHNLALKRPFMAAQTKLKVVDADGIKEAEVDLTNH